MTGVRRTFFVIVLAATAAAAAVAYQAAARERDYQALLSQGDAALGDDQTFGAIEAYSGAIALRPDSMLAHLRRGQTYHRRGDLEAAVRDLRTAAALDPTATRPLDELGDVLYQMQRFQRAAEVYESCLRLDDRLTRVSYKLGLARFRDRNIDGAIAALTQTIRMDDRTADAYYLLGLCLREKKRLRDAQNAYENALAIAPGLIAAREELADVFASQARRNEELEQLQVIAGLDRDHPERHIAVGLAHARAGHADLAVLTLANVLERTPDQPLVYAALGRVWLDIAESKNDGAALSKAIEALGRVAASSATSEVLTLYGRALLQNDEADLAENILQQATTRYPIEPSAFLFYANAAERQDHLDVARGALIEYGSLVRDDTTLVNRATRIAALSMQLNDPTTAIEWLQRILVATPNDVRILALIADARWKMGDLDAARETVARALELDPTNRSLVALSRRFR